MGNKCIACGGDNRYFDYCTKKCSRCAEGQDFNPESQTCVTDAGGFYTELSNRNLIVTGDRAFYDVAKEIKSKITKRMVECPHSTPFFNGNNCINCESPAKYFDLISQKCVGCAQGTFNVQLRKCREEEIVPFIEGKFKEVTHKNTTTKEGGFS